MAGGITAQYGFLYQKCAFIYTILRNIGANNFFTYEGADDIDVNLDSSLYLLSKSRQSFIQVKSGIIDENCMKKVVGNWMILNNPADDAELYIIAENPLPFELYDDDFVDSIIAAFLTGKEMKKGAIFRSAYDKYADQLDKPEFRECVLSVLHSMRINVIPFAELDKEIANLFQQDYCQDINTYEIAKEKRLERFICYIFEEVDSAMKRKEPFSIGYSSMIKILQKVCEEISDRKYTVDVRKTKKKLLPAAQRYISELDSREVQQLKFVNSDESFVIDGIVHELMYIDFRKVYNEQRPIDVSNIEDEANDNYMDILNSFPSRDRSPTKLYQATTERTIENDLLPKSSVYRKGCYIYLTGNSVEDDLQISWRVEDA